MPKKRCPEAPDPLLPDSVDAYRKQTRRYPRLNLEEQLAAGKAIKRGQLAQRRKDSGKPYNKEDIAFGQDSKRQLILSHLAFIPPCARKYQGRGLGLPDLIEEGNLGLIRAAEKYDYQRGYTFLTFASVLVHRAITRAINKTGREIRLPTYLYTRINKICSTEKYLTQELGRKPSEEELARELGTTPKKIRKTLGLAQQPLSLDQPLKTGYETSTTLGEYLEDTRAAADPEKASLLAQGEKHVEEMLDRLSPRERDIITRHLNLTDQTDGVNTLEEISHDYHLTRERIRQIQEKALRKLRTTVTPHQ